MGFLKSAVVWLMAVLVTGAVLVGIPLLLLSAQTSVAIPRDFDQIANLNDRAVLGLLVIVAWVSWAWLAFAIVREFVATARGRATRDARGAGLAQMFARLLVTGLFRLGTTSTAVVGIASPLVGAGGLVAAASMVEAQEADPSIQDYVDALASESNQLPLVDEGDSGDDGADVPEVEPELVAVAVSPLDDSVPYEVVDGDTLWGISERYLGDGFRHSEIFDRSEGFVQPGADDRVLVDPELINPGMIVLLPSDAVGVPIVDESKVHAVYGLADSLAGNVATDGPTPDDIDDVETLDLVEAEVVDDGELLIDDVELPGTTVDDGSNVDGGAEQEFDLPEIDDPDERVIVDAETSSGRPDIGWVVASGAGVGLASLLVKVLRDRRQETLGTAGSDMTLATPSKQESGHEARIVAGANTARIAWFDDAMMSLRSPDGPQPLLATLTPSECEVMFTGRVGRGDEPWEHVEVSDETDSLRVSRNVKFERIFEANSVPLMVEVTDELWLNLEAVGTVCLSGDLNMAQGLLRALLTQIEYAPQTRDGQIAITPRAASLLGHESVTKEPEEIVESNSQWASDTISNLTDAGVGSCFNLRSASNDPFVPVVVVCTSDDVELASMWEQARDSQRCPVVFAVLGEVEGMYPLVLSSGGEVAMGAPDPMFGRAGYVSAHAWELSAQMMERASETVPSRPIEVPRMIHGESNEQPVLNYAAPVDEPVATAAEMGDSVGSEDADVSPEAGPGEVADDGELVIDLSDGASTELAPWDDPQYARIRLLGPVSVEGLGVQLSEQHLSVLTFLTVFGAVKTDKVVEALWASRSENVDLDQLASTFRTAVTRLRAAAGAKFVPAASTDGQYRTEWVTTDLEEFTRRLQSAAGIDDRDERLTMLVSALELVSGELFLTDSDKWWSWITTHDFRFYLEPSEAVVDAACEAADLGLQLGRYDDAEAACMQGLAAAPYSERIASRLVKVKVVMGAPDAAEAFLNMWEGRFDDVEDAPPEPREMFEIAIAGAA